MASELAQQFIQRLAADIPLIREALKSKGVEADEAKLSEVAEKIKSIPISYTGSLTVNYPKAWNSGYIFYKKNGVSGEAQRIICNGSGVATVTVTEPGTYTVTNSHQEEDSFEVTFNAA